MDAFAWPAKAINQAVRLVFLGEWTHDLPISKSHRCRPHSGVHRDASPTPRLLHPPNASGSHCSARVCTHKSIIIFLTICLLLILILESCINLHFLLDSFYPFLLRLLYVLFVLSHNRQDSYPCTRHVILLWP